MTGVYNFTCLVNILDWCTSVMPVLLLTMCLWQSHLLPSMFGYTQRPDCSCTLLSPQLCRGQFVFMEHFTSVAVTTIFVFLSPAEDFPSRQSKLLTSMLVTVIIVRAGEHNFVIHRHIDHNSLCSQLNNKQRSVLSGVGWTVSFYHSWQHSLLQCDDAMSCTWQCEMTTALPMVNQRPMTHCSR